MSEPKDAEYTIIGGGAVGCGVAWSLVDRGVRDVQLLERGAIASQTTGQGAGLCGQLRTSVDRVRLAKKSVETFQNFHEKTGFDAGWRPVGSLRLSLTEERDAEFEHLLSVAAKAGLEARSISKQEIRERFPSLVVDQIRSAIWCPSDGYLSAPGLARAYAQAAAARGANVCTGVGVLGLDLAGGRIQGVHTTAGYFRTKVLINAAGVGAGAIAAMAGIELPIVPVRHEYFITEPIAGFHADLPVVRIPDLRLYLRPEGDRLLLGGFEADALSLDPSSLPTDGSYPPLEADGPVLRQFADDFDALLPGVRSLRWERVQKGWPTFTPDGKYLVGRTSRVDGLFFAAGCNAHGVSGSAGLAEHLLEAMFNPAPCEYVRSLSPDRFLAGPRDRARDRTDAQSIYATYYATEAIAQGGVWTP